MRGSVTSRRGVLRLRQLISAVGSVKIKLVLGIVVVFTLVALAGRASEFMGWNSRSASLQRFDDSSFVELELDLKGYAIVMNTWKRYDLLKQSISHYSRCPRLDSIHLVWSEPSPPSESLKKFLSNIIEVNTRDGRKVKLKFDVNKEDSVNNRFKEIPDLETDAVFSIDDDVVFPCSSVEFAFDVWQSASDNMVGFVPRMHWVDTTNGKMGHYIYGGWWSVWWTGTYSMVLSKAAFFHKKYLKLYTNEMPASIKDFITKNRNCEDIAMSFLVANVTGAPPIWVKGKIFEIGSTGISSAGGHIEKRTQCVDRFAAEFGRMPLVPTSVKAVDSRKIWFW